MPTIDIPDKICPHCSGTKWYVHNGRMWCFESRKKSTAKQYSKIDKKEYNRKRLTTDGYKKQLEKRRTERTEYRKLNPIIRPKPLTTAEKSSRSHAKRKNDFLYKEKNRKRAADWLLINKEKMMTSNRYARQQLGEQTSPEQRERYIIYLKCLRQLKQIENEKESN